MSREKRFRQVTVLTKNEIEFRLTEVGLVI